MRLASEPASILDTRMRPNVLRSASASQAPRNTSSGSRKLSLPQPSEPAAFTAAATTDSGLSEGSARPNRSNWAPTPFNARNGRARSSESRHV